MKKVKRSAVSNSIAAGSKQKSKGASSAKSKKVNESREDKKSLIKSITVFSDFFSQDALQKADHNLLEEISEKVADWANLNMEPGKHGHGTGRQIGH